ncbi:MAG: hypothetical protein EA398_13880 [Deltaproteobacteria bacterium]|nr:MAG: hypothetical protein EA398_13880 [Deltaproteobacteria bacterium]
MPAGSVREESMLVHVGVKVLHVLGVIAWVGGALSLSVLMAWRAGQDEAGRRALAVPMRRLALGVVLPGLVLALAAGVWLLVTKLEYFRLAVWFHIKLPLVLLAAGDTGLCVFRAVWLSEEPGEAGPAAASEWRRVGVMVGVVAVVVGLALFKLPIRLAG